LLPPTTGSKAKTGPCSLISHNLTHPSRPPVTISGDPFPIFNPPHPSIEFIIDLCP